MTTVPAVFAPEQGLAFIERQQRRIASGEGIALAIVQRSSARAVGHMWLGVRPQPAVLGIGYWLIHSARGQGLARRAVQLTSRWALRDLAAARVEAWVEPDNERSLQTLDAAGFVKEGLLRSFLGDHSTRHDMLVLSLVPSDL